MVCDSFLKHFRDSWMTNGRKTYCFCVLQFYSVTVIPTFSFSPLFLIKFEPLFPCSKKSTQKTFGTSQLLRMSFEDLHVCSYLHYDCLTFCRIPIFLLHKAHHLLRSTGCGQYKYFPLSRSCCDLPSRHAASDPQARQLRQDLCSSHSPGCTVKREGKDLLRFVTSACNHEKITIGRRALA